jgi:hypothetical protein
LYRLGLESGFARHSSSSSTGLYAPQTKGFNIFNGKKVWFFRGTRFWFEELWELVAIDMGLN